jgi:glycosidase
MLSNKEIPKTREETAKMEFSYAENKKAFNLLNIATLLQFTLYGVPSVYYGDEIGTNGGKDPFNRTCFNWEFDEFNREVYGFYKQISAIRSNNACFIDGECKVLKAENGMFAFTRETDSERVLVCVNLGEYSHLIKSDKEFTNLLNGTKGTKFDIDKNNYIILRQKI